MAQSQFAAGCKADITVVQLLPDLSALYRRKVAELTEQLNIPDLKDEAGDLIRSLLDKVAIISDPSDADGFRLELHGALAGILSLCEGSSGYEKRLSSFLLRR